MSSWQLNFSSIIIPRNLVLCVCLIGSPLFVTEVCQDNKCFDGKNMKTCYVSDIVYRCAIRVVYLAIFYQTRDLKLCHTPNVHMGCSQLYKRPIY